MLHKHATTNVIHSYHANSSALFITKKKKKTTNIYFLLTF
jgi:hypothetical protein